MPVPGPFSLVVWMEVYRSFFVTWLLDDGPGPVPDRVTGGTKLRHTWGPGGPSGPQGRARSAPPREAGRGGGISRARGGRSHPARVGHEDGGRTPRGAGRPLITGGVPRKCNHEGQTRSRSR